jgi:hypothetical protein
MLLGPRVSIAPRCLALPHPAAAHQARLSPGPTRQSLRPRRSRLPPPLFAARPPRPRDVRRPLLSKRPRATTPMPCQLTWRRTPSPPPSPLLLLPPRDTESTPTHPMPHPASAQKGVTRHRHTLHSFSLPRSPLRTAKRAASHPHRRPSHRGPLLHISDRRHRRPPTVRPTNPPPFPILEPPSPLLSSPIAPGASRSHHRPSLR